MQNLSEIERKRERLGVTLKEMCARADVHQSTLSRARTGRKEPTARIRAKLSHALDEIASERGIQIIPAEGAEQ
ncbi:helix-turn-helix transcriptional regulator [Shinella zoogloeoides]|uniref:helix-turn-helix transcriptional regulator n=1 Tax=Shinella zoogloeoides TaxID=352475 RepID=UPI0028B04FDE|nr:helix-turn-helix transcriptional regulator [Shinella zoogloeoides]